MVFCGGFWAWTVCNDVMDGDYVRGQKTGRLACWLTLHRGKQKITEEGNLGIPGGWICWEIFPNCGGDRQRPWLRGTGFLERALTFTCRF